MGAFSFSQNLLVSLELRILFSMFCALRIPPQIPISDVLIFSLYVRRHHIFGQFHHLGESLLGLCDLLRSRTCFVSRTTM